VYAIKCLCMISNVTVPNRTINNIAIQLMKDWLLLDTRRNGIKTHSVRSDAKRYGDSVRNRENSVHMRVICTRFVCNVYNMLEFLHDRLSFVSSA
jgi:hypothetical protein